MTTAVVKHGENSDWTEDQVALIKRTIAVGATNDELRMFLHQAKRTGLDPLSRQIHFVKRKDKGTIQTAIDGYRLIADRTGKYAGSDDYLFDEGLSQYQHIASDRGKPTTATVSVWKMVDGVPTKFTATAEWGAYFPGDAQGFMWKKMPYLMLGKCAEALALRKAFPAELSGIYTNEEMQQATTEPPTYRQSNTERMKQLQQPDEQPPTPVSQAVAGAPPPSETPQGHQSETGPFTEEDNPAAEWKERIRNAVSSAALNAIYKACPDELKQDIYKEYSEAMKGFNKK